MEPPPPPPWDGILPHRSERNKSTSEEYSPSAIPTPINFVNLKPWRKPHDHKFLLPKKLINNGADLTFFHTTEAYRDIMEFVMKLNHSVCPRLLSNGRVQTFVLSEDEEDEGKYCVQVRRVREMLGKVEQVIEQVPAEDYADRRFGNRAFRRFYEVVFGKRGELFEGLGFNEEGAMAELGVYLMGSWGSPERLDYGTGHELSFLAFVGGLWKLGYFGTGEVALRQIVLVIIQRYLQVVRRLILTYSLEPAGSHGVWGLDDHSFLPYIFGSAQYTKPIKDEDDPVPLEGSAPGTPKPSEVSNAASVQNLRKENMYFSAIGFIYDVKKGPFWEHSPTLYDISGISHGWGKINKGMIKMYDAEVLGKLPVVQHFPFGSLWKWEQATDINMRPQGSTLHAASQPVPTTILPTRPYMTTDDERVVKYIEQGRRSSDGVPGRASNQYSITKAPWAKD